MMRFLAYLPALAFLALAGYANALFAMSLSDERPLQLFWLGVALASTLYTVTGLSTCSRQWLSGNVSRVLAAAILLVLALAYDALAAYGLSRAEQHRAAESVTKSQQALADARASVEALERDLAPLVDAPTVAVALTSEALARNAAARREASATTTRAREKERLGALLEHAKALRASLQAPAGDARNDVLPPALVAWLPVVLVTLGALVGLYTLEQPSPKPPVSHPLEMPKQPPVEPFQEPESPASALLDLYRKPPAPLHVDAKGWLRGTQRQLATQLGVSPPKLNRLLRQAAADKQIALDMSGGTAFRPQL